MSDAPQNRNGNGADPRRDASGRFGAGNRANPGGRPKGLAKQVREQYPESELVSDQIKIARGLKIKGMKPTIRDMLQARDWLTERGWGKAAAFAPIEGGDPLERDEADRALAEVADELGARRQARGAGGNSEPGAEAPDPGDAADGTLAAAGED